jgi:hypothetical protein
MLVKRKRRSPTKPVTRELAVYSGQTFLGAVKLGAKATAYDSHNTRIGESPCALGISGGGNALWAACGSEPLEKLFTVCMPSLPHAAHKAFPPPDMPNAQGDCRP